MTLCIETPKDSTRKLLELINKFSKVARDKMNIWKFIAFLHTNNELSGRKTKKTIPLATASKKKKIPRNKPNQRCKRPVLRKL